MLFRQVVLPTIDERLDIYCFECDCLMMPVTVSSRYFHGEFQIHVGNIAATQCPRCHQTVYSSETAKAIWKAVRDVVNKEEVE